MAASTGLDAILLDRREKWILGSTGAIICSIFWILSGSGHSIAHPHAGTHLATSFVMWLGMMIAMMLPPVFPWIWFFAAATKKGSGEVSWGRTLVFGSGYFTLWAGYSLIAAICQTYIQWKGWLHPHHLKIAPFWGGFVLLIAGVAQLTPLKNACLKHCRSPLGYFMTSWKEGSVGAFNMGLGHGIYCLGCCWAIMAISFALGTMNMLWMAAATIILCMEKIAPNGEKLVKPFGLALIVWGMVLMTRVV